MRGQQRSVTLHVGADEARTLLLVDVGGCSWSADGDASARGSRLLALISPVAVCFGRGVCVGRGVALCGRRWCEGLLRIESFTSDERTACARVFTLAASVDARVVMRDTVHVNARWHQVGLVRR